MSENGELLGSEKVIVDNKIFFLDLLENSRGRVLRVSELSQGVRRSLMIPAPALREVSLSLQSLVEFAARI